jgi:hypothetical protein
MSEAELILKKLYGRMAYRFPDKSGTRCNACGLTRVHSDDKVRHRRSCDLAQAAALLGIPFEYVDTTTRNVRSLAQ